MKKIINVNNNFIVDLQRLSVEVESRKNLLAFMIEHNYDITSEAFNKYQDEYSKLFCEYDLKKSEFEKLLKQDDCDSKKLLSWNLDFISGECELVLED